jgi:hypothetical protein
VPDSMGHVDRQADPFVPAYRREIKLAV